MSTLMVACHESCSLRLFVPTMIIGIFISVLGSTLLTSHLFIWVFLVVGTLSVCSWLKTKVSSDALVLYFVVSVLGRLLFLVSCSGFWFSSILLQLALLLKLGLAPFHFWVFKVLGPMSIGPLIFFLGPPKVGLLWLSVSISHPSLILSSASLLLGVSVLWVSAKVQYVLYGSGSCQLLILMLLGPSSFLCYYFIYLLALLGVFWSSCSLLSFFFAFLGLGSLPPLSLFWGKVFALSRLPLGGCVVVLLSSLVCLFPYIRCSLVFDSRSPSSLFHGVILTILPIFLVAL